MSESRQAAWRRRRSSSVSFGPGPSNRASVQVHSSRACSAERERWRAYSRQKDSSGSFLRSDLRQQAVDQALADAEHREVDGAGGEALQEPLEHQRAVGQDLAALLGELLHAGHRGELLGPADLLAELDRLRRRHGVAVHHAQGIARPLHVQTGNGAPGAADRVEGAAAALVDPGHARDRLVGDVDRLLDPALGGVEQPQAAERQRGGPAQRLAFDPDQLEAAAAEVAGDPVRRAEAHHDAVGSELRLALAGEHLDAGAERLLAAGDEVGSVGGIAAGGGGDRPHVLDAEDAGDDLEPAQRLECQLNSLLAQAAGRADLAAEAAQTFSLKIGVGLLTAPS